MMMDLFWLTSGVELRRLHLAACVFTSRGETADLLLGGKSTQIYDITFPLADPFIQRQYLD